MRKLTYTINIKHFKEIRKDIVPTIFTKHQFSLIEKKVAGKRLTLSEKNEFSRTVSRKMKAINLISNREDIFIYGKEKIKKDRLNKAKKYLKQLSRKFKNKHIIISGSFLYKEKYNDIDIFIISKYDKEDYKLKKFHINYLTEDVYSSLFFASSKKLCVSNKEIKDCSIHEEDAMNKFISIYQETFNDLDKKFKGVRSTIREFLLYSAFIAQLPIPDSIELRMQTDSILKIKKPKELIKNIFVKSIILSKEKNKIKIMKDMVSSYKDVMEEYKQHKAYYLDLVEGFKEVISIES